MLNLTRCGSCDGFLPRLSIACPHCGATAIGTLAKAATTAVLGSAVSLTLMACYGPPPACEPGENCNASGSSSGGSSSSSGGSSSSSSSSGGSTDAGADAAHDGGDAGPADGGGDADPVDAGGD